MLLQTFARRTAALCPFFLCCATLLASSQSHCTAQETFTLRDLPDGRSWSVEANVSGQGQFQFPLGAGEKNPREQNVEVAATYRYATSRLPNGGRNADAYRAVRQYQEATSNIAVGEHKTTMQLRAERKQIVAAATEKGVSYYSPAGGLNASEVELLPFPGEDVLLPALLPESPVTVGQTWTPDSWIAGTLAATEVALKSKLTCQLETVKDGQALINLEGEIEGLARGTTTNSVVRGQLRYDMTKQAIVSAAIEQREIRKPGPLNPGMTLTLTTRLVRRPVTGDLAIAETLIESIPAATPADAMRLEYDASWGATLAYPREWQVYKQANQMLIVRLLDSGAFVAQGNIAPVHQASNGKKIGLEQFEADIRAALGQRIKELKPAEETQVGDLQVFRIAVTGVKTEASTHEDAQTPEPCLWRYYLISNPQGQQAVLVVTLAPELLDRLADRDLELIRGFSFAATPQPTRAAQK